MPVSEILQSWQTEPTIAANIAAWQTTPARAAQLVPYPENLHPALVRALQATGISLLYTHQATAWNHVQAGAHPIVVTGTASGKTLCYNLSILDRAIRDPEARALYLFPTKALAQDQLAALRALVDHLPPHPDRDAEKPNLTAATYDGDTPSAARPAIRSGGQLVLSNPDMLHMGILPHHTDWAEFFRHLAYVVIDEAHTYRGVFGSHVANVLRRLKRIARFYGARPQFILTSATIGNPTELGERLVEEPVVLVDDDGAPQGETHFIIYNPPVVDLALGLRRSMLLETVRLAGQLLKGDVQTIVFGRARNTVEVIHKYLQDLPARTGSRSSRSIRAYRSGYLAQQRREIERGLRDGSVRAVVATTALELGVDIGGMEAALLAGYPGTIAGTRQQAGRAGRKADTSMAAMVVSPGPLDQFLAHHPEYLFGRSPEQALIQPDNTLILYHHLRCAAYELPFHDGEGFGRVEEEQVAAFLQLLQDAGDLHRSGDRTFWMSASYPSRDISLRSSSADPVVLQTTSGDRSVIVGHLDQASAHWMAHPGAVYLHEGEQYLVEALDLEGKVARLRREALDYYTQPQSETNVQLVEALATEQRDTATKTHGEILLTRQVVGFRKVKWFTHEQLGHGDLDLPPTELLTTGYWLTPSETVLERLRDQDLWNNDPNNYGPNWPAQRNAARARDGHRCQVCGIPEQGQQHDVHHKIPFRRFESPEQANELSNLVTLCSRCHHQAEQAVRMRSGLSGLAFVLGHLAPLFLMCDARDIGVHADPRSPLAEGQPTVVLYDGIPAGIGFSERLYALHDDLLSQACDLVAQCPCADGCPSCVGPAGEMGWGGKAETLALLQELVR